MDYSKVFESSVKGTIEYLQESGLKTMILGISGGIDSTVCAAIGKEIVNRDPTINITGVYLPTTTNKTEESTSAIMTGTAFFEIGNFWEKSMESMYADTSEWCSDGIAFSREDKNHRISEGNIKARLRMIYLRDLASKLGGLVIDTSNLSEYYLGFFTISGDVGDISPIGELWKHEVYELANWIKDNHATLSEKEAIEYSLSLTPTDGNGVSDGGDLEQIAPTLNSYLQLDEILMTYLDYKNKPDESNLFELQKLADKYGEESISNIIKRHKWSEFKRRFGPKKIKLDLTREKPDIRKVYSHIKMKL